MFLGAWSSKTQTEANTLVRVHRSEPVQPVQLASGGVIFADGIPLATGEWFRLSDDVDQWWFSVQDDIDSGNPITYNFEQIYDDCFFAGSTTVPEDFILTGGGNVPAPFNQAVNDTCQVVIARAAMLKGYYALNSDSVLNYLHFFDRNTAGTIGVGTRVLSLGIPAGAAANLSQINQPFKNGIVVAASTTRGGNTPPAADLDVNIWTL